jgi:uncharacterized cupredoxin-like copper-binding protein
MSMLRRLGSLRPFALGWALVLIGAACSSGPATWTFQPTPEATAQASGGPASGSPAASATPAANATPAASGSPSASGGCSADATVIKIEETATLRMVPASVDATAGGKVCFQVTNTAGFTHNFYVGPASDIEARNQSAAVAGIPDFTSGTMTLQYTFTGSGPFEFACWVPGHLEAGMKGTVNLK